MYDIRQRVVLNSEGFGKRYVIVNIESNNLPFYDVSITIQKMYDIPNMLTSLL